MFNQIVPFFPFRGAWPFYHKWNVSTFIVEKLFSACMAYAMVSKKYDQGILNNTFSFEPFDHLTNMPVGYSNCIEISCPVSEENRIIWIIGRQFNQIVGSGFKSKLVYHSFFKNFIVFFRGSPYFPPV